tara:strand:- start:238 stop:408 length:171 start_codon:yes stop_codon:yes gene_type:complete
MVTYQKLGQVLIAMEDHQIQIEQEKVVTIKKETVTIRKNKSTQEIIILDKEILNET